MTSTDVDESSLVTAFNGDSGPPGTYFSRLRRPGGEFLRPWIPDPAIPAAWKLGITGMGVRCAVVDSGVWFEHPVLHAALDDAIDVTGPPINPSDDNGHGTAVALVLLAVAPDQHIVSIKALDHEAKGRPEWLIAGVERAAEAGVDAVNLSAGVYRRDCEGDCDVCEAAIRASSRVKVVATASGNRPGATACPAKGLKIHRRGFAVEAIDFVQDKRLSESGIGSVGGNVYRYVFGTAES